MKQLFNFAYVPQWPAPGFADLSELRDFMQTKKIDGVEMFVYDSSIDNTAYKAETIGCHLQYWPCWLPLFEDNKPLLNSRFQSPEELQAFYGASFYEGWLEVQRRNIEAALTLEPEYLVWHVADNALEEIFTFNFKRTNMDVLNATVEVFKELAPSIPKNVKVLFENLWWPGLNLTNNKETEWFFNQLSGYNVGIMLDTGHLLNTDYTATNEAEAIAVLINKVRNMGSLKGLIKGMHLNLSLSAEYRRECRKRTVSNPSPEVIGEHIRSIDQHRAFTDKRLWQFIELVKPEYVNHELYFDSRDTLAGLLDKQLAACKGRMY